MSVKSQDQVELFDLLFGMNWEDPESDRRALAIQPGETVTTISSGGCNTLTLLLEDPGKIYAVDINPSQGYLLELKRAAVRHLDYNELRAFLGLTRSGQRLQTFERLRGDLSGPALAYWTAKSEAIQNGVIYSGKYETFIRLFNRILAVIQGRKRIDGFFRCETLEQQKLYFDQRWNTFQWRLLFKLLINKRMLAKRGLTADYFKFDDGATSFADSFFRRTRNAMREIPVASNYFIAQYLRGSYLSEDAVPAYLLKENLPIVKARLDRIEIVTSDSQGWLARQAAVSIDAFALSNICELMSLDETGRLFAEVARTAKPNARICFRNLIVPREVPESLASVIEFQPELSRNLIAQDRSFVYSRVQALIVRKNAVVTNE
jgi:S-adenosylmethionine-diacylglycerol 3-amino-3-carboxypropyl transferase